MRNTASKVPQVRTEPTPTASSIAGSCLLGFVTEDPSQQSVQASGGTLQSQREPKTEPFDTTPGRRARPMRSVACFHKSQTERRCCLFVSPVLVPTMDPTDHITGILVYWQGLVCLATSTTGARRRQQATTTSAWLCGCEVSVAMQHHVFTMSFWNCPFYCHTAPQNGEHLNEEPWLHGMSEFR